MHSEIQAGDSVRSLPPLRPPVEQPGLEEELVWRRARSLEDIVASRWKDDRTGSRRQTATSPPGHYVVSLALKAVQLRLSRDGVSLFEGTMPVGMMHVTAPGQRLEAEFVSPCDFIHLHIAADYFHARQPARQSADFADLMVRDVLAAELGRTLTAPDGMGDRIYVQSVGNMILMRLLALRPASPRVCALPKWRLRRVLSYVEANIGEPITLGDLAGAAGLSRMHFAAQFKAATGCRPHEHVLQQRIETAQAMMSNSDTALVEVALSVGFQTQSHFSTVFKRVTGQTPARWRRMRDTQHMTGRRAMQIEVSPAVRA